MSQDINVNLKLTDGGTVNARISDTQKLNKEVEKLTANTEKASQAGSRMPRSAQMAAERATPVSPTEAANYGAMRGAAGANGGTARDFAAQAQGLGGLVRLYATFAANIFAVTSAYTALSNAFKTEKMIQAAEKFSSTVGVSMSSVAKSLQEVTQYSLSFQDAIKFTNVGTAAGLAAKDIQNLTVIAKGAATALGRDVGESIQRIIQGTAKQEQEILDELGIFIKAKKAFDDYAEARGVKADDLTATQRTLAYAEAVAQAGEKWKEFAQVEDPFGKLNASMQNALTDTLNLVNKIVAPLVKLLADSSDAIIALGALIVTVLGKQALPELKEGLLSMLTFDKSRAQRAADNLKVTIGAELTKVKTEAQEVRKQLELAGSTMIDFSNKNARVNAVEGLVPKEMLQTGSGKGTSYGLSASRLGTELFKDEDLSKFKKLEDVNKAVENSIREQLKGKENQSKILDGMIAKGILEKTSTESNLVLSQKTLDVNRNILGFAQQRTAEMAVAIAAQEKQEALLARQVQLEKQLAAAGGERASRVSSGDIVAASKAATMAAPALVAQSQALKTVADDVANSTLKTASALTVASTNLKTSFASVSEELAKGRVAAAADGMGIASGFALAGASASALGTTLSTIPAQLAAATGASAKFGVVAAAAGATAAIGFSLVRQAVAGLMAALGPIMIAVTVWQLFGDKIREAFGANIAYEKAMKEANESGKAYIRTLTEMSVALSNSNKALRDETSTLAQITKAYEVQTNALASISAAYSTYIQKLEQAKALEASKDLGKKAGLNLNEDQLESIKQARAAVAGLSEASLAAKALGVSTPEIDKQTESIKRLLEQMDNIGSFRASQREGQFSKLLKEINEVLLKGSQAVAETDKVKKASETATANTNKLSTSFEGIGKALDTDTLNKLDALNKGFKDVAASKAADSAKKLSESFKGLSTLNAAQLRQMFNVKGTEIDNLDKLVRANKLLGNSYKELIPLEAMLSELRASDAVLALSSSTEAQRDSARARGDAVRSQLALFMQSESFVKGTTSLFQGLNKSTDQYSVSAKNLFKQMEQEIRAAEAALRALNAQLEVSGKLNALRATVSGAVNLDNNDSQKRLEIVNKEFEVEKAKAALALQRVLMSNQNDGPTKQAAKEAYADTVLSLVATKEQKSILESISVIERDRSQALKNNAEATERESTAAATSLAIETARKDLYITKANSIMQALGYTSEEMALQTLLLEQDKQRLTIAGQLAAIEAEKRSKIAEVDINTKALKEGIQASGGSTEDLSKADADRVAKVTEINAKYDEQRNKQLALKSISEEKLALEISTAKALSDQAKESKKVGQAYASIAGAFKNTGLEKQAKAFVDLLKVSTAGKQKLANLDAAEVKRKNELGKLDKVRAEAEQGLTIEQVESYKALTEAGVKGAEERRDAELNATLESLSAFKGMFSEKTLAYKVIDGIEKAMHVAKLAMMAKELLFTTASVGPTLAAEGAKNAARGAGAILEALKAPFPIGFATGAAMAAIVASILGGGAKKVTIPGGMSAKDRQETQGTGMSWVNGQKVENGGGVFGDTSAKSESIKNSLEIIADNTIEGLSFDRQMLNALESIDKSIGGAAKSLYSVQGIRTGSAFGTQDTSVKTSGIKGLFGSSTTKDLVDSGIKISGAFTDIAKGLGLLQQYETTQVTKRKSGFLGIGASTNVSFETQTKNLDSAISAELQNIFRQSTLMFKEIGSVAGITAQEVDSKLAGVSVNLEASLKGLKGEDLEKELNAVISSALDTAAGAIFTSMKQYQEFGEGLLETVVRVTDANKKVNLALKAIGNASSQWGNLNYSVTEAIVENFGGLDKFTETIESFRDNFLTEAEKLAPVAAAVTAEMSRLGYATVDTREEFKALVQSLNLAVPAQQELYISLMRLSESFAEVYKETTESLDATEYRNRLLEQEITILGLLGKQTESLALSRQQELSDLEKLAVGQKEQLIYNQKVIWALEDALAQREQEVALLGVLGLNYEQLVAQRELELNGLTDNLKILKKSQYAVEDYNNSQSLMIDLLNLEGKTKEATAITRQNELKGLSTVDKLIKQRIYSMEDEASLLDELRTAQDKQNSTLETTINNTKEYIKSLDAYRTSLLQGNLSILNPQDKYNEAKSRALELANTANSVATTPEQEAAKKAARESLTSATTAWLEASRTLFASSDTYVADFNTVLSLLEATKVGASTSLTDAEKQLEELKKSSMYLTDISESTRTTTEILADLKTVLADGQNLATPPTDLASYYGVDKLNVSIGTLASVLDRAVSSIVKPAEPMPLPEKDINPGKGIPQIGNANTTQEELAKQIAGLKQEVEGLRADNRENTAALIDAGYRSSNANAELIGEEFTNSLELSSWREMNQASLR